MRASTMALIFLGISAVMYLVNFDVLSLVGAAGACGWAALAARGGGITGSSVGLRERLRVWRLRRRYRVISGGRDTKRWMN
jgi:hypothetical protein